MLTELSVVEQRYLAVREALDGARITAVATRYGVDRRTVHRWLTRYGTEGLGALADRSCRPDRCPHQIAPEIEARIVAGGRGGEGGGGGGAQDYKRWERSRPMELSQMDVMGGVLLEDGTECKVITGIDDHSRFCVIAKVVLRATARPVCEALLEALSRHGVPGQILTDNGKVFTGKLAPKPATVAFDRLCLNNGIRHLLTAPYSPTTTGKIERLHKTVRKELIDGRRFSRIEHAQRELDAWAAYYNVEREHQAIGDVAPIRRFELVEKTSTDVVDPHPSTEQAPQPPRRMVGRRVDRAGRISILKHRYHVGRHLAGQAVSVELVDGLLHVSHGGVLIATHARRHLAEDDGTNRWPSKGIQARSTHHGGGGPAQGRHLRIGELRRHLLPGGQPLRWPRGRSPCGGRYGADHPGWGASSDPPSPARHGQGVRSTGKPDRQA